MDVDGGRKDLFVGVMEDGGKRGRGEEGKRGRREGRRSERMCVLQYMQ